MRNLQLQAVQHGGRMLGHSASLSATDTMRWRDVHFENTHGESNFGTVMAATPKRKSDGHEAATSKRVSQANAFLQQQSQVPRVSSGIRIAPDGSLMLEPSQGSFTRPLSREELIASLQASAQRLQQRPNGFNKPMPVQPGSPMAPQRVAQVADMRMPVQRSHSLMSQDAAARAMLQQQLFAGGAAAGPPGSVQRNMPTNMSPRSQGGAPPGRMGASPMEGVSTSHGGYGSPAITDLQNDLSRLRTGSESSMSSPQLQMRQMQMQYRPQPPASPRQQEGVLRGAKSPAAPLVPSRLSASFTAAQSPLANRMPLGTSNLGVLTQIPPSPPGSAGPTSPNTMVRQSSMRTASSNVIPEPMDTGSLSHATSADQEMADADTSYDGSKGPKASKGIMGAIKKVFG